MDEARAALDEQYDLSLREPMIALRPVTCARGQDLRQRLAAAFARLNERIWRRLPVRVRDLSPVRAYGAWLHALVCRRADREMYLGTLSPESSGARVDEAPRREARIRGGRLTIAVLGCSIGVEVYSILWTVRSSRPDLDVAVHAVDISPDVVRVARERRLQPRGIGDGPFLDLRGTDRRLNVAEMFDWDGDEGTIKPWLRDGITWQVGDACDPNLITSARATGSGGRQQLPLPYAPRTAQPCLRNLARLVSPGGYLFVTGVDLDVRTKVALELGWDPVTGAGAEIHDGDPLVRSDWPCQWGLEPLDRPRPDWETRYSAVFRVRTGRVGCERRLPRRPTSASVPRALPPRQLAGLRSGRGRWLLRSREPRIGRPLDGHGASATGSPNSLLRVRVSADAAMRIGRGRPASTRQASTRRSTTSLERSVTPVWAPELLRASSPGQLKCYCERSNAKGR